jgi:hypothetical protein
MEDSFVLRHWLTTLLSIRRNTGAKRYTSSPDLLEDTRRVVAEPGTLTLSHDLISQIAWSRLQR